MDGIISLFSSLLPFLLVLFVLVSSAIKIVQEYERGVVFRLGRYAGTRGPGLILLIPFIERMVKVDLRVVTLDVPSQEAITGTMSPCGSMPSSTSRWLTPTRP